MKTLLKIIKAIYFYSPHIIVSKLRNLFFFKKSESLNTKKQHNIIDDLLNSKIFSDVFLFKLKQLNRKHFILLGDISLLKSWNLPANHNGISITAKEWNWDASVQHERSNNHAIVICRIPRTSEEWHTIVTIRKNTGIHVYTIMELIVPFTRISFLQGKLDYFMKTFDEIAPYYLGQKYFGPFEDLNREFNLSGKRVIEFGPFDGCQTAGLVNSGVQSVDCIEVRSENATKTRAAIDAFNWSNVKIIMDDFHNVQSTNYGSYDLAFAHGVYYHSIAPFHFLENLMGLADVVFIGGFCATDEIPPGSHELLEYEGVGYKVKKYVESFDFTSGVNTYAYFFYPEDLMKFFTLRGYKVKVISDEPVTITAGRFLRFLAKKMS